MDKYFVFNNIIPYSPGNEKEGSYIVLAGVEKLPAHIMLCIDGCLYDWSINGVRSGLPTDLIMKRLFTGQKSVLLIQIPSLSKDIVKNIFESYVKKVRITCLTPVQKSIELCYNCQVESIEGVIFEVLEFLKKENKIINIYGFGKVIENNHFDMLYYNRRRVLRNITKEKLKGNAK